MRHLVCVCLHEGRAGGGACNIVTTGGICRQPVEPINKAQHIRHGYVGDKKVPASHVLTKHYLPFSFRALQRWPDLRVF